MTSRGSRKLTARQASVLGVVANCGPVSVADVGEYHLPIGASSARAALNALERKGMVSAVYTGSKVHGPARHYEITGEGVTALAEHDEPEED